MSDQPPHDAKTTERIAALERAFHILRNSFRESAASIDAHIYMGLVDKLHDFEHAFADFQRDL